MKKYKVDLTSFENSHEGRVLFALWQHHLLDALLLWRDEYLGSPFNGMKHLLDLNLSRPDLEAFFQLIDEFLTRKNEVYYAPGLHALKERAGLA